MEYTKQKALDYLESNADIKEVFATTDGFLFLKNSDALEHAKSLDADNPTVEKFTKDENDSQSEDNANDALENADNGDNPKLTPVEYKELKEKATAEYKELFGEDPDSKLSGAKIQALNDAKKTELDNAKN